MLRDHRELDTVRLASGDEAVGGFERDLDRLFHDHVLAGGGGLHTDLRVQAAGYAHADDVHIRSGKQFLDIGVCLGSELCPKLTGALSGRVGDRDQAGVWQLGNGPRVIWRYDAAADDAESMDPRVHGVAMCRT